MTFDEYVEDEKEKAKKLGKAEGIKEGLAKGKAEGEMNQKISIAKKMIKSNMSIDVISEFTGLTKDEILKLK